MFTTDTQTLRTAIGQLERGVEAMRRNEGRFQWSAVAVPDANDCMTNGCCWGWTALANGVQIKLTSLSAFMRSYEQFMGLVSLPHAWGNYIFSLYGNGDSRRSREAYEIGGHPDSGDVDTAIARMNRLISRLRHRLAVCEVEQSEWGHLRPGRQLPAAELPVGEERERLVAGAMA